MKKSFAFRLVTSLTISGFLLTEIFSSRIFFKNLSISYSMILGGLGFFLLLAYTFLTLKKVRAFRENPAALQGDPKAFKACLNLLGAVPLASLSDIYLLVVLVYLGVAGAIGVFAYKLNVVRIVIVSAFELGTGMFWGAFLYVLLDKVVLTFLLGNSVKFYPADLRSDRQGKKMFIIPLFLSIMTMILSVFYLLLLVVDYQGALSAVSMMKELLLGFLPIAAGFIIAISVLMAVWNSNTRLLYQSVIEQLDRVVSHEKDLTGRIDIGSVDEIATISGRVNVLCDLLADSVGGIRTMVADLTAIQNKLFESVASSTGRVTGIAEQIDRSLTLVDVENKALALTLSSGGEVRSGIQNIAERSSLQAESSNESSEMIRSMINSLGSVAKATRRGEAQHGQPRGHVPPGRSQHQDDHRDSHDRGQAIPLRRGNQQDDLRTSFQDEPSIHECRHRSGPCR